MGGFLGTITTYVVDPDEGQQHPHAQQPPIQVGERLVGPLVVLQEEEPVLHTHHPGGGGRAVLRLEELAGQGQAAERLGLPADGAAGGAMRDPDAFLRALGEDARADKSAEGVGAVVLWGGLGFGGGVGVHTYVRSIYIDKIHL